MRKLITHERPEKYYWLWLKRAPGTVETTVEWLLKHVKISSFCVQSVHFVDRLLITGRERSTKKL